MIQHRQVDEAAPETGSFYDEGPRWHTQGDIYELPESVAQGLWDLPDASWEADVVGDDEDMPGDLPRFARTPPLERLSASPLEVRLTMLVTPTASMRVPGTGTYAHDLRTLVPVVSADYLRSARILSDGEFREAEQMDALDRYMFLPPYGRVLRPSFALLEEPVTAYSRVLDGSRRIAQLSHQGIQQLQRKLVWYATGGHLRLPRAEFLPPRG